MNNSVNYSMYNREKKNSDLFGRMTVPVSADGLENKTCENGTGTIIVQAYTANGSVPVQGAKVTISNKGGDVLYELYTDQSGRTTKAKVCVPDAANSQKEGNGKNTYGAFDIKVEKQGYYKEDFLDVAFFDGIESIQPAVLEPLGENSIESDKSPSSGTRDKQSGGGGGLSDSSARVGDTLIIREQPTPVVDIQKTGQEGE